jgi:hypothetical protein
MGDVVNLRRFRKQKDRAGKEARAEENRAKFGRSKGEKTRQTAEAAREDRDMDGKRLNRTDD